MILMAGVGVGLCVLVLYRVLSGVPWIVQGEVGGTSRQTSNREYIFLAGSGLILVVTGVLGLIHTLRAEVVVDPWGITVFGIGMRPSFRAAWETSPRSRW